MKLIRTKIRNVIGPADIRRISCEMINIYHGRKLFEEDGTPVAGATLDNTPATYLEWEEGSMRYNYIPVRAFIHVNFKGGIYDTAFRAAAVRNQLLAEFQFLNRWGWRSEIYTDHQLGTSQFTVEKYDSTLYTTGAELCITQGEPFHTKNREFKFTWVISDRPSLFQYSAPGKFPKPYNMPAAIATIALDVAHTVTDLEDGFRCTSFPPLMKNVDVVARTLNLSRRVGVEAHIYTLMGGPSPDSRCWDDEHMEYTASLEKRPLWKEGTKVHLVKELKEMAKVKSDADNEGTRCTVCRVDVFDKYYQVQRDGPDGNPVRVVVCKFCAHWNTKANSEMNTGNYKIAVATSSTTAASLVEIVSASIQERDVIRHLLREQAKGTLKYVTPKEGDDFAIVNKCHSGALITKLGNTHIVGMQSCKEYQEVLEQIHRFPDHTHVFEYRICFD
jgi:hypothetical protein